jgi:hypothetical protein
MSAESRRQTKRLCGFAGSISFAQRIVVASAHTPCRSVDAKAMIRKITQFTPFQAFILALLPMLSNM